MIKGAAQRKPLLEERSPSELDVAMAVCASPRQSSQASASESFLRSLSLPVMVKSVAPSCFSVFMFEINYLLRLKDI